MFKLLAKVLFLLILVGQMLSAQSSNSPVDSAEIKKVYAPWSTFTSLRSEVLFEKGSSLYGEFSYISPKAYSSLNETYRSYLWLGYEQALSSKWYGGISGRMNFVEAGPGSFFTRVNLSHRGYIGKFFFYKEFLTFEHLYYASSGSYKRKAEGRYAPSIGIGRAFDIGGRALYIGVNYRLFVNFDFQNDNSSIYDKRKIDRTKLRFDVTYQFLPHWCAGVYYLRDTEYYFTLAQYNQYNQVVVPNYKLNQITQGLGITLSYLLFNEKPDKYIPGLPSR